MEKPNGFFISWFFLSVGKIFAFFCTELTGNGLRQFSDELKLEPLRAALNPINF